MYVYFMISIVIASVLKPTDEVRMYKRIGTSLAKTTKYDVNIIGIKSKKRTAPVPNIIQHSLNQKGRNIFSRLSNLIQVQKLITDIRPELVIVTSPDLLYIVTHHRNKNNFKVIYDLQEDYYKNITQQRIYTWLLRQPIAWLTRYLEKRSSRHLSGLWLAEDAYSKEISFAKSLQNKLVLENKYHGTLHSRKEYNHHTLQLLFTGTISTYSGVQEAIKVYQEISASGHHAQLRIVGICHEKQLQTQLQELAKRDDHIKLTGLHYFVPHDEITYWIRRSDIAIMGYRPNTINANKIPSKLHEYLAYQLPVIVADGSSWKKILANYNLDIGVDFDKISGTDIVQRFHCIKKSSEINVTPHCLWHSIEKEMLQFISNII